MGVNKKKLVVSHGGVKIYHSWKGTQPLTFWYAMVPNYKAEGDQDLDFDIRLLPEDYTGGLAMQAPVRDLESFERLLQAHKEALRRAIDGGHDFLGAPKASRRAWRPPTTTTGLAGLFWRWMERLGRS